MPAGFLARSLYAELNQMHRRTARFLLILLLVGVFAPVALAISAPVPHACCLRKAMHDHASHNAAFQSLPGCCQHDCCHPVPVSQWARLSPRANTTVALAAAN